jgi:hypothetical protein
MKLWSLQYNESNLDNFPQICYKGIVLPVTKEVLLVNELFKIFYLTCRDAKQQIKEIELNKFELPYKKLYELVFPPKNVEFHTEYFIDLLNLFSIELENF